MSAVADDGRTVAPIAPPRPAWVLIAPVALIVIVDQLTKVWAVATLSDGDIWLIGDTVGLTLTRNSGGAFSMFQGATPVIALIATGVAFALWRVARRTTDRWLVIGLTLLLGGALGNLVDRFVRSPGVLRGHVVDFMNVAPIPVFNVADACITIGAVVLVVRSLFGPDIDGAAADGSSTEPSPS